LHGSEKTNLKSMKTPSTAHPRNLETFRKGWNSLETFRKGWNSLTI
jgi:hypothetical protein